MIKTKKELIKLIDKIGEMKIKQGIEFKTLSLSIQSRKEERTLKEWQEFIKPILKKLEGGIKE